MPVNWIGNDFGQKQLTEAESLHNTSIALLHCIQDYDKLIAQN